MLSWVCGRVPPVCASNSSRLLLGFAQEALFPFYKCAFGQDPPDDVTLPNYVCKDLTCKQGPIWRLQGLGLEGMFLGGTAEPRTEGS